MGDRPAARCLRRGLAVLAELNRRRFATAAEIAQSIGVPRPTVHRLLLALADEGYVEQLGGSEQFWTRERVCELASGQDIQAQALMIARGLVDQLAGEVEWPIDLLLFDGDAMVVRHSTFSASRSLLPQSPLGQRVPLCGTAPGRMFLAGLPPSGRERFLASANEEEPRAIALAETRGYALRDGGIVPRTSALAVAVTNDATTLLCITMAFIRSSVELKVAITTHVPLLTEVARQTERAIRASDRH